MKLRSVLLSLAMVVFSQLMAAATGLPQKSASGKSSKAATQKKLTEADILEARRLLAELGYWIEPEVPKLDESLKHALTAFQKVEGRARTGRLTLQELEALRVAKAPMPLESGTPHVEIDLAKQVLFLVEADGVPLRILPVSTGSEECFTDDGFTRRAYTPLGRFKVLRKIEGWRKSPLGLLYYPNYFFDGIAIHGNPAVPPKPASHGCVRIPMFASQKFSELTPVGTLVIVYDSTGAKHKVAACPGDELEEEESQKLSPRSNEGERSTRRKNEIRQD